MTATAAAVGPPPSPGDRGGSAATATPPATRERILEAALELFTEEGVERTSLRQIAARVGVTKAALYYHFPSKDAILLALTDRVDEVWQILVSAFEHGFDITALRRAIVAGLDWLVANQRWWAMMERNRAAFEALAARDPERLATHLEQHAFVERQLRDPAVPLADRVRVACTIGVISGALSLRGMFGAPVQEVRELILEAVDAVLGVPRDR